MVEVRIRCHGLVKGESGSIQTLYSHKVNIRLLLVCRKPLCREAVTVGCT